MKRLQLFLFVCLLSITSHANDDFFKIILKFKLIELKLTIENPQDVDERIAALEAGLLDNLASLFENQNFSLDHLYDNQNTGLLQVIINPDSHLKLLRTIVNELGFNDAAAIALIGDLNGLTFLEAVNQLKLHDISDLLCSFHLYWLAFAGPQRRAMLIQCLKNKNIPGQCFMPNLNVRCGRQHNWTMLHALVALFDDELVDLLLSGDFTDVINIDAQDSFKRTPLHVAILVSPITVADELAQLNIIQMLLRRGATVDQNAVLFAIHGDNVEILRILLQHCIDNGIHLDIGALRENIPLHPDFDHALEFNALLDQYEQAMSEPIVTNINDTMQTNATLENGTPQIPAPNFLPEAPAITQPSLLTLELPPPSSLSLL